VRLPISELQGKWKLGQNRLPSDRSTLLAGYEAQSTPAYDALASVTRIAFQPE